MRILLVEDEEGLADALEYVLKKNKYLVDVAYDGIDGQDMGESNIYDLIILDRMLPRKEGVEILRYLRNKGIKTPVIFLTAKDTIENKVEGLDAGADDYLVKPFSTDELLARVRALGRRNDNINIDNKISISNLVLNTNACEVLCGEEKIKLTLKESQLLEYLMKNSKQVLTKEQILIKVWGADSEVELNSVELYVYYLRKKLDLKKCKVKISTVRGVGYCLKEM